MGEVKLRSQNDFWMDQDRETTPHSESAVSMYIVNYLIRKISFTSCVLVDVGCTCDDVGRHGVCVCPPNCRWTWVYFSLALLTSTVISKPSVYASARVSKPSRSTKATQAGTNHSSTSNLLAMAILSTLVTDDPSLLISLIDRLRAPSHSYL